MQQEARLGFVGIVIEDRRRASEAVNRVLSEHGDGIVARVGIPYQRRGCAVITLVVDMTTDELGILTGKLGMVKGVTVKSAMARAGGVKA